MQPYRGSGDTCYPKAIAKRYATDSNLMLIWRFPRRKKTHVSGKTCTCRSRTCICCGRPRLSPSAGSLAQAAEGSHNPLCLHNWRIALRRAAWDGAKRALAKASRHIRAIEEEQTNESVIVAGLAFTKSLLANGQGACQADG